MVHLTSLLTFLLTAMSLGVSGASTDSPKMSLAFAARVKAVGGTNIAAADRARVKVLLDNALRSEGGSHFGKPSNLPVTNSAVTYTTSVSVGNPATQYSLLIDTGSSNTWIGATTKYTPTGTSRSTNETVAVRYGSGSFNGTEYIDQVALSDTLVIANQSIGVAAFADGFQGIDGILGIGPVGLTKKTTSGGELVSTVTDNLFAQGTIPTNAIGIFYAPTTNESDTNGELTFGGADLTKINGTVNYVPLTKTSPSSKYWGVDQTVTYGDAPILNNTAGIVDTGTTLILFATDAFNAYQNATGAVLDDATGLLKITPDQYANLKPLNFVIGGITYGLTPNAQIWPRSLNIALGGDPSLIYLVVADLGQLLGKGLDFINGYTFLERFYTVYDTSNQQVGFAPTNFTDATTN